MEDTLTGSQLQNNGGPGKKEELFDTSLSIYMQMINQETNQRDGIKMCHIALHLLDYPHHILILSTTSISYAPQTAHVLCNLLSL